MIDESEPKVEEETLLALREPDHPRFYLKKMAVRCRDRGRGRVLRRNLRLRLDEFGNPEFIYHSTTIARLLPDGVRISSGGYHTYSTKDNINSVLALCTNSRVFQKKFEWRVIVRPTPIPGLDYEDDMIIEYKTTGLNRRMWYYFRKKYNL